MDRRSWLGSTAAAGLTAWTATSTASPRVPPPRTSLGLVLYVLAIRRRWLQQTGSQEDIFQPTRFLQLCADMGSGGMQVRLGVMEDTAAEGLRDSAAERGMFIDAIVNPPKDKRDLSRFAAEVKTAARAGAKAIRTVIMPGRRYERFRSLAEFKDYSQRGRRMVELAVPVVEKQQIPLAIENHKDQRNAERIALFSHIDSEFVGACVDTGNSFALLEDPLETVRALAPWAKTVHLKDQAIQECPHGFLLGDIPLGQGCFDLPKMVAILKQAQPNIQFVLELITRDPLVVPCLKESYFTTMPAVPAAVLARTLSRVRRDRSDMLQQVSQRTLNQQVALETANVSASLAYARDVLEH